jgi:hypothetical protein
MKAYIHARLTRSDCEVLARLKKSTGHSESELVRRGLHLIDKELGRARTALETAGSSVGQFKKGPRDLARNKRHLTGFGE